jgi:hypothetical protein
MQLYSSCVLAHEDCSPLSDRTLLSRSIPFRAPVMTVLGDERTMTSVVACRTEILQYIKAVNY